MSRSETKHPDVPEALLKEDCHFEYVLKIFEIFKQNNNAVISSVTMRPMELDFWQMDENTHIRQKYPTPQHFRDDMEIFWKTGQVKTMLNKNLVTREFYSSLEERITQNNPKYNPSVTCKVGSVNVVHLSELP